MEKATTAAVAKALSFAIDEFQEFGGHEGPLGLYLDEAEDLRVTEVSPDLENFTSRPASQFTVKTSDGQEWNVRVTPKA